VGFLKKKKEMRLHSVYIVTQYKNAIINFTRLDYVTMLSHNTNLAWFKNISSILNTEKLNFALIHFLLRSKIVVSQYRQSNS